MRTERRKKLTQDNSVCATYSLRSVGLNDVGSIYGFVVDMARLDATAAVTHNDRHRTSHNLPLNQGHTSPFSTFAGGS